MFRSLTRRILPKFSTLASKPAFKSAGNTVFVLSVFAGSAALAHTLLNGKTPPPKPVTTEPERKKSLLCEPTHLDLACSSLKKELADAGLPGLASELRMSKSVLKGSTVLRHLMMPKPTWTSGDLDIYVPNNASARHMSLYLTAQGYTGACNIEHRDEYSNALVCRMVCPGKPPIDIIEKKKDAVDDLQFLRNEFDGAQITCFDLDSVISMRSPYITHCGWCSTDEVIKRVEKYAKRGFVVTVPDKVLYNIGRRKIVDLNR